MSILARDKVPPKTVKANINIPHCRGIPTKLPNQSHSRVVSKRLCKQKGEERRREGGGKKVKEKERKTEGAGEKKGGENVRRLSNDRQLLLPFRAKVQRSEVKARRKNCHEWANRPRASSAHVYFTVYSPRVYESTCICTGRGVETYEWYYALRLLRTDLIALSSPSENRTPVVTPSVPLRSMDWTM